MPEPRSPTSPTSSPTSSSSIRARADVLRKEIANIEREEKEVKNKIMELKLEQNVMKSVAAKFEKKDQQDGARAD